MPMPPIRTFHTITPARPPLPCPAKLEPLPVRGPAPRFPKYLLFRRRFLNPFSSSQRLVYRFFLHIINTHNPTHNSHTHTNVLEKFLSTHSHSNYSLAIMADRYASQLSSNHARERNFSVASAFRICRVANPSPCRRRTSPLIPPTTPPAIPRR